MKPLTVMAWDTATARTCAAIVSVGPDGAFEAISEFEQEGGPSHSRILPPQVANMLRAAGLTPAGLDLLAAGRGPGSFTGLRTGLSLAKGLAMGADIPLMGLSTLETLAAQMIFEKGAPLAAPVIDARHNEIFTALYRAAPNGGLELECLLPPQPVAPAGFAALMASAAPEADLSVALAEPGDPPSAVMLARLAAARLARLGRLALEANPPLPTYIRRPDIRPAGVLMR